MFEDIPVCTLEKPAVRALEVSQVKAQGQDLLMVRDPLGLLEGAALMAMDPVLLVFLQMADGETTLGEMAQKATMLTGQIIPEGMFQSVAKQLDEALLLQSERFVEAMKEKFEKWEKSDTRPAKVFHAPDADRLAMMKELGDEFRRHEMSSLSPPKELDLPPASVRAILSPHIDYQRGGECYAWAYKALKDKGTAARTIIVLGTSHRPATQRFIATRKHYETPFGTIETNREMLDELATEYGHQLFEDEYLHADEHTVELQAIYLKKIFQDRDVKIIPILVSSFDDMLHEETDPSSDEQVRDFTAALRKIMEKYGDDVALIGGVDFSHCGPEFGDEALNEPEREKEIEASDRRVLDAIESKDSKAFVDAFRPTLNDTKVCSIGAMYCVLEAMKDEGPAKVLSYQQANSPDKTCLVSFASVAFLKKGAELKPASKIILLS